MGKKAKSSVNKSTDDEISKTKDADCRSLSKPRKKNENRNGKRLMEKSQVFSCIGLLLFFSITVSYFMLKWSPMPLQNDVWDMETLRMFDEYDENKDGYLSLSEFAEILRSKKIQIQPSRSDDYHLQVSPQDEMITIQSFFMPLNRSTMTKDFQSSTHALQGLLEWTLSNKPWCNFAVRHFMPFLPSHHSVGYTWTLLYSSLTMFVSQLSSNRYWPPQVTNKEVIFHQLLHMFHPFPFIYSRFAPQGAMAVVRAENDETLDVVFRIHAEFQLNKPPLYPFWFTPAQFTGNVIISKDMSKLHFFQMYVPNEVQLNVDMEWLNGPGENENMEVDIGFVPLMKLNSSSPSVSASWRQEDGKVQNLNESFIHSPDNYESIIKSIKWKNEISYNKAQQIIQQEMYPFTQIEYLDYEEAFLRAKLENKLVHSILLWGALTDQSC